MKSFGFTSLAALRLSKREAHELKLGITEVPGKYSCIVSLLLFRDISVIRYIIPSEPVLVPQKILLTFYIAVDFMPFTCPKARERFESLKLKGISREQDLVIDLKRSRV